MDVFNCLTNKLNSSDPKLLQVALEGIENLLKSAQIAAASNKSDQNEFVLRFEENGGLDNLEALQSHSSAQIYQKSLQILETYFVFDEEPL